VTDGEVDVQAYVAERAASWYDDVGNESVTVTRTGGRDQVGVKVDELRIEAGEVRHDVFAKQYHDRNIPAPTTRPRLGLPDDRATKPESEYRGLVELHRLLESAPHGVRAVRPLEFAPGLRLLVTERFPGVNARQLMRGRAVGAPEAFAHGGEALALGHRIDVPGAAMRTSFDDLDADFKRLHDYVVGRFSRSKLMTIVANWWAHDPPSGPLALGAGHGDCSPRNLLVDERGAVAWIDGLFRRRVPIFEDVATFTTSVRVTARMTGMRAAFGSRGRERVASAFVDGYERHAPVDRRWLERFEVVALVDRLASMLSQPSSLRYRVLAHVVGAELSAVIGMRRRDDR
jgi:hypothetical protein